MSVRDDRAAIPEGLEPLAVWDVRERLGPWREWTNGGEETDDSVDAVLWAMCNLAPSRNIYRIEFYLLDCPLAVVHRWKLGEDGRKFALEPGGEGVTEAPAVQMLAELPPAHLLG